MSPLLPKADIRQGIEHVCFVPEADIARARFAARLPLRVFPGCLGVLFANVMKAKHPW
jgi:hypothetical protein